MEDGDSDDMDKGRRKVARGGANNSARNNDDSCSPSDADADDAAAATATVAAPECPDTIDAKLGIDTDVGMLLLINGDADGDVAGNAGDVRTAAAPPCCCWYCCLVCRLPLQCSLRSREYIQMSHTAQ